MHIACAHCGTTNRVPDERLAQDPVCGRCGQPLLAGEPVELTDANFEAVTSPAELVGWMQSLDVFVCTSRHEGHANGVLEALAAGVPCVLAQIPAHQDIAGAQAAILFEPEDTMAFRSIMQNLQQDVGLRNSLVSNGTYYLERFHNWDKHVEDTLELYRSGLRGW